jgi:hypothetical protein
VTKSSERQAVPVAGEDREAALNITLFTRSLKPDDYRYEGTCEHFRSGGRDDWEVVQAFARHRLAALSRLTEPARKADRLGEGVDLPEGMKPWAGGDAAPADWDGGPAFLRNGSTMFPSKVSLAYHANGTNRWNHQRANRNPDWDIIAYSAALPDPTHTREAELREATERALLCTPSISPAGYDEARIIYDCGDPWEILRAALFAGSAQ